jgi:hypothetical protein
MEKNQANDDVTSLIEAVTRLPPEKLVKFQAWYVKKYSKNDRLLVHKLECLQKKHKERFEIWKFHEDRGDKLRGRMWTIGTWRIAVLAAILALSFNKDFMEVRKEPFQLVIPNWIPVTATLALSFNKDFMEVRKEPFQLVIPNWIPVTVLAVFGLIFGVFSLFVIHDMKGHIQSNWTKAAYALTNYWEEIRFRKTGWRVLLVLTIFELVAFAGLLILSLFPDWLRAWVWVIVE